MDSGVLTADIGNVGLLVCALIDTTAALSYAWRARGGPHGTWWRTPTGLHLMCFMAAFAVVLDQSVIYQLTGPGLLASHVAIPRPDWFAWLRVTSFALLIPPVLAWRLWLIWRPPRGPGVKGEDPQ